MIENKKLNFVCTSILIFCFGIYTFSLFRHFDPDLWGHLKFGEYIYVHQLIPYKDIFAFVPTKSMWVNHEWLSEVIFYLLLKLNTTGIFLLLFKALICTLAIFIPWLYISRKTDNHYINTLIFLVIILTFSYGTAIRPQIFSYLFFSITLLIIELYGLKGKLTYIVLIIIFILWANLHGGVLAGLALVYFYAFFDLITKYVFVGSNKKQEYNSKYLKILILPVLLSLVLIVNPYTYHYYAYIIDAIIMKRPFIDEWKSLLSAVANFTYLNILVTITLLFIILSLKNLNKQKVYNILLILLIMAISMTHTRHIPFLAIVCAYYLPVLIADLLLTEEFKLRINLNIPKISEQIISIFLIGISILLLYYSFFEKGKLRYYLKISLITAPQYVGYPLNTVKFIKDNNLRGNLITNFTWGEFIIYHLYPEIKVSLDGRYETVYPANVVADNMLFISAKPGWEKLLNKYGPDLVLVSKYDPVSSNMLILPGWKLIYLDLEAFLFIKIK